MSEGLRLLRRARTAVPSLVTFTADETYVALAFREINFGCRAFSIWRIRQVSTPTVR